MQRSFLLAQEAGFEAAFEEHVDEIRAFLARRVGRDLGEELAAETFARAFAAWSSYDVRRGAVRPWLFGIATNLAHDHRRSETRGLRAMARTGNDVASEGADVRIDDVLTHAEKRHLAGALAKLRSGDRDVLLLAAWADLNSQEIAAALEIPAGTVRSRLNRARRQVQAALRAGSAPASWIAVEHAKRIAAKEVVDGNG